MKRLVLVLAATGCFADATVTEVPPQQMPTAQVQVAAPGLMHAGENWIGRYQCAQGTTDLDLRIDAVSGNQIDATFLFAHGPSGAAGSYRLRGLIGSDGSLTLAPTAEPWIARPPNYIAVGMSGVVDASAYRGRIDNPSCGAFIVHRANEQ